MQKPMPHFLRRSPLTLLLAVALPAGIAAHARALADDVQERLASEGVVTWRGANPTAPVLAVTVVSLNDLHGHLTAAGELADAFDTRRVGGMVAVSGVLAAERQQSPRRSIVLIAGDSIGGSPPASGLLRDEPMMEVLNDLADRDCKPISRPAESGPVPGNPLLETRCRFISVLGNHEFDRGTAELERLLYGGAHPKGPVLGQPWKGSRVTWLSGNVVRRGTGQPFLPGAAIVDLDGIRLGVIGITTAETPALVPHGRVDDLEFLPEVPAINASIAHLKAAKADAIVLVIHEGLSGPTVPQGLPLGTDEVHGRLADILSRVEPGLDLVVSGHTHKFTNLLLRGRDGRPVTVTQSRVDGTAYGETLLLIDPAKHAVVEKSSTVRTVWSPNPAGEKPDEQVIKVVKKAVKETAAVTDRVVGTVAQPITRISNDSGESALGNLVADAQRAAAHTDFAFMNAGGLRADLAAGAATFGALYSIQPFGNVVMRAKMSGAQILRLLESQWSGSHRDRPVLLHVSGLSYLYNWSRPAEHRVVAAYDGSGQELKPDRDYSVAVNDYLLFGGDQYPVFGELTGAVPVVSDLEALTDYVSAASAPLEPHIEGRTTRVGRP